MELLMYIFCFIINLSIWYSLVIDRETNVVKDIIKFISIISMAGSLLKLIEIMLKN